MPSKKIIFFLSIPFELVVHISINGCYFMIRLWISIAIQNDIYKSSKDPVLCICMNFSSFNDILPNKGPVIQNVRVGRNFHKNPFNFAEYG